MNLILKGTSDNNETVYRSILTGISSGNQAESTIIEIADADLTLLNGFAAAYSEQLGTIAVLMM